MSKLSYLRTYKEKKDLIKKSFYMFDLDSFEGRLSLLKSLPLLDQEIIKQAYEHVFPEYDTTDLDIKRAKAELRGVILNLLKEDEQLTGGI